MIVGARRRPLHVAAAILPLVAFLLPIMLLFLGFAVDLSYMQATRMELRCATDCAARGSRDGVSSARQRKPPPETKRRRPRGLTWWPAKGFG